MLKKVVYILKLLDLVKSGCGRFDTLTDRNAGRALERNYLLVYLNGEHVCHAGDEFDDAF